MATASERGTIQGWHVLAAVLAFFGIIFAVNGVFLYMALNTHTGIVSKQPYRKGLDYNKRIAANDRQQALGWTESVTLDLQAGTARLVLTDRNGRPVSGLIVKGLVGRPSTEQHDIPVELTESSAPGTYTTTVSGLAPGNWLLQLKAETMRPGGLETVYRVRKRLWLKR